EEANKLRRSLELLIMNGSEEVKNNADRLKQSFEEMDILRVAHLSLFVAGHRYYCEDVRVFLDKVEVDHENEENRKKTSISEMNMNIEDHDLVISSLSGEEEKINSLIYDDQSNSTHQVSTTDLPNRSMERSRKEQFSLEINIPKIKGIENYNILCLFDFEFPYTKLLFETLTTDQISMLRNKWVQDKENDLIEDIWQLCPLKILVDEYSKVIKENTNEDTLNLNLKKLMLTFSMPLFEYGYHHQKNYELLWCQNFYREMTLQMLREHSSLKDSSTSVCQYRGEIVDPLISTIFYDIDNAVWIKTQEGSSEKNDNKHDGILYFDIKDTKFEVGYVGVVGNAFTTSRSDKIFCLEKLLKATMKSIQHQNEYIKFDSTTLKQSFAVLVFGREYYLLCMRLIEDMYIMDEYDTFTLPSSNFDFSEIESIVKA
ncbi:7205_t:CDS:10, partial [Acaulospora morrowiae]